MARGGKEKKEQSTGGSLLELAVIVVVALGLALGIQAFLVKPYRIPSGSMEPTLDIGQRILVNRLGHNFSTPDVGDIVVFHPPRGAESEQCGGRSSENQLCGTPGRRRADQNYVKRVVAGPGDRVRLQDGHVILNGESQAAEEERLDMEPCGSGAGCSFSNEITVPADHYFMMGDNRGESTDSRFWGPVPNEWVIGGAFATYWPPNRVGTL